MACLKHQAVLFGYQFFLTIADTDVTHNEMHLPSACEESWSF
jgi:hypothetical protein